LLREARLQLRHGAFLPWIKAEFDFSIRTAQNYTRAHKFAAKNATVAHLETSQLTPTALYHLSEVLFEYGWKESKNALALVLKEASEKRVTRDRAEEIIQTEWDRELAEEPEPNPAPLVGEEDVEAESESEEVSPETIEAEAIIAAGSELPPPTPTPQSSPLDRAVLTTFEEAIQSLKGVMTKPALEFKPSYFTAADLTTVAEFLKEVATMKSSTSQSSETKGEPT
jgi:hypothetical protein